MIFICTNRRLCSRRVRVWGEPPVRGDTAPGMRRERVVTSHVTPPWGGSVGRLPWEVVQGALGPHMKRPL